MAMDDGRHPRASYADIEALPPHILGELIRGRLYTHARPALRHLHGASRLNLLLGRHYAEEIGSNGGWWFLEEPELHLLDDVVIPDLAGWRVERVPHLPDVAYYTMPPDWVCEVLSPSTAMIDRTIKMPLYAKAGVSHLWLLDPALRTLEVFAREGARWLLLGVHAEDTRVRAEPFSAIELNLDVLWLRSR
jgi:Uma2 family endonuclease